MPKVLVLNGPNLNRLGAREPDVYGTGSYEELGRTLTALAVELGVDIDVRQTNDESEMVSWLHEAADESTPVILNPAAFTHYSYALRDACALLTAPIIEVHLSNPLAREEFRHTSVVSGVVTGTISGLGFDSYLLALRAIAARM
jgi:3-dehydroquinate dehydratase-2